uniref:GRF-type domain-containing protein n=1 Tax=Leersia perrieri TaxID=77586 RepID=A0A0D9W3U9_9ORYZ
MYIEAKAKYEQKVQASSINWRINPLGIPEWSERPKCYCNDRCKVTTSCANATHGRRYFSCANKDDAFTANPTRCVFVQWIDNDVPNYAGEPVTEVETSNEYMHMHRKNEVLLRRDSRHR